MKKPSHVLALALGTVILATAVHAAPPPVLDRELFFGNPEIAGAQLSPDGKYIAFLKPWKETRNVWVKGIDEAWDKARLVTADTKRPIPGFFWSRDSKYILFVQDKDGDENYNVHAVDPAAAKGEEAPPARNLTEAKGARAYIYAVPKAAPDTIYVGLNDRDPAWHDLYKVSIASGKRELMRTNNERISGWVFDLAGNLRLAERVTDKGDSELLRVDPEGFTPVYTCTVLESCGVERFHKDGKRVYLQTNKGEPDLVGLVLFDPASGHEEFVESDPLKRVDQSHAIFSEATEELVATAYYDERRRLYFRDKEIEADQKFLDKALAGREASVNSATADDRLWLVTASSDTDPGERYLFDRNTKKLTPQYKVRERIPREHMAPMTAIRYPSSDGLEIPAYLTLPKGVPGKKLPTIVLPHGGPWARDQWGFSNLSQFLANRGYAVLQPNFRGSTGYGKKFINAGNRQWGEKMQDDITWGVKHLVAKGIADPKRVGIMGGSYGGYATLAGVAFTPDLYAAAVSIVGPSNLITLLETIPPYWEAGRIIFHERMGNPNTPEGKKQLERQSPLNSVGRIKTPLLVAQGANDPRVKKAESDQIVIALRDRGFPVEYVVAPDEGHGFARPVNSMSVNAAAETFLAKHLGGRFQKGGTAEVEKRLAEITVDPKTVVLAPKVDAAQVGVPRTAADLAPTKASYAGTLQIGGQSLPLTIEHTVTEEGGDWVVTDKASLPMGEMTDVTVVSKGSLILKKRSTQQGPMQLQLTFGKEKAEGSMSMGGAPSPVSVAIDGPVFADGAASLDAVAALPLAEGYKTTFRNFDTQKQKIGLKQLTVLGSEEIVVPAGTFQTWKTEVKSAEGDPGALTLWVAKDARKVVKLNAALPGEVTVTTELQP